MGVRCVPSVVIDGEVVGCCTANGVIELLENKGLRKTLKSPPRISVRCADQCEDFQNYAEVLRSSLSKEALKTIRRKLTVSDGVLNVAMTKIGLQSSRIDPYSPTQNHSYGEACGGVRFKT
jgi:hypothetical protein